MGEPDPEFDRESTDEAPFRQEEFRHLVVLVADHTVPEAFVNARGRPVVAVLMFVLFVIQVSYSAIVESVAIDIGIAIAIDIDIDIGIAIDIAIAIAIDIDIAIAIAIAIEGLFGVRR